MNEVHFKYERYPFLYKVVAVYENAETVIKTTRRQTEAEDTAFNFMLRDSRVEFCRIEEIRPWTKVVRVNETNEGND